MTTSRTIHPPLPAPGSYALDPARSTLRFTARHLFGLGRVRGTFPALAGVIQVREPVGDSLVQVEIDAAGIDTGNGGRDERVRGSALLDTGRHPTITFRGEGIRLGNEDASLPGELTVRGTSRPVTLRVRQWDGGGRGGEVTAAATARIDRYVFGVTALRGLAGRYLDVDIRVTCVRG